MENDEVCAQGKVFSPSEDVLQLQSLFYEKQNSILENEFTLDETDIYKELRIMGYDYSGEFRGLKNIRTNDFQHFRGVSEWKGNIVPYLDSLLQSMILSTPFRKLMVPVMLKSIKIDPKLLFEFLKLNKVDDITDKGLESKYETELRGVAEDFEMDQKVSRFCLFKAHVPFYVNMKSK